MSDSTSVLKTWTCATCGKHYRHNSHLRRHEATHQLRHKFHCPYCKRTFSRGDVCKNHIKRCLKNQPTIPTPESSHDSSSSTHVTPSKSAAVGHIPVFSSPLADMPLIKAMIEPNLPTVWEYLDTTENAGVKNEDVPELDNNNQPVYPKEGNLPALNDLADFFPSDYSSMLTDIISSFDPDQDFDMLSLSSQSAIPVLTDDGFRVLERISVDLVQDLNDLHHSLVALDPTYDGKFDRNEAKVALCAENLRTFAALFFRLSAIHIPFVHHPTFGNSKTSKVLIFAIAISGAHRARPINHALIVRGYSRLSEEYIMREIEEAVASSAEHELPSSDALQAMQAGLITQFRMFFDGDTKLIQRARSSSLPTLVAAIRHFKIAEIQYVPGVDWNQFIYYETCVRLVSWTLVAAWHHSLTHYHSPSISTSEIACNFPCPQQLWNALDSTSYILAKEKIQDRRISITLSLTRSMKDFLNAIMATDWIYIANATPDILPMYTLYLTAFGLGAMTISACQMGTLSISASPLLRALDRWQQLYKQAISLLDEAAINKLGMIPWAAEYCLFAKTLIEARVDGVENVFFDSVSHTSLEPMGRLLVQLSTGDEEKTLG